MSRVRVSHDTMSRAGSKRRTRPLRAMYRAHSKPRKRKRNPVPERQLTDSPEKWAGAGKYPDFPHNSCSVKPNTEMCGRAGIDPPRGRPERYRRLESTGGVRDHDALREGGVGRMSPVLS